MKFSLIKFSAAISKKLGYYVYLYTDPRDGEVFYVGKGKGNRAFSHLEENSEHEKGQVISAIRETGLEPQIEILVHGLEEESALRVEASVIDLLGKENLTNRASGYRSGTHGRMTIEQLKGIYESEPVEVTEPTILIKVSRLYRHNMSAMELYDATRHAWPVGDRASIVKYAFAVYDGIVKEVYEIGAWLDAGTTSLLHQPHGGKGVEKRKEFVGRVAPEQIRERYRYKSVAKYFNKTRYPFVYAGITE